MTKCVWGGGGCICVSLTGQQDYTTIVTPLPLSLLLVISPFDILPSGFEDVIQVHFAIQREAIMKQLSQWVKEVISPEHERRLRKAIDEFRAEMDKL